MAPQGLSVIPHNQSLEKLANVADLFTLSMPRKRKKAKKRKRVDSTPVTPIPSKKRKHTFFEPTNDLIVLDSDSNSEARKGVDDDVIVLNAPVEEIVVSDSDNEPVVIRNPAEEIIQLSDAESVQIKQNIVININQTLSVDKIVSSTLTNDVNEINNNPVNSVRSTKRRVDSKDSNYCKWAQSIGYPKSWTEEMIRFYTEPCDEKRNFDYVEVLNNFKTKPSDWWINRADLMGSPRKRRSFGQCRKCGKYGHLERECTKNFVCYICGDYSHLSHNCPNTICLTCGRPASKNVRDCNICRKGLSEKKPCGLCGQIYHEEKMCPSKWRRHSMLNAPSEPIRLNTRKFCYNCAQKGHFGFECPYTPYSDYPQENPLITSFFNRGDQNCNDIVSTENNVIFLSKETTDLLCSEKGSKFLEQLSKNTNARIEFFRGIQDYIKIIGPETAVNFFQSELLVLKFGS